jgi:outer membrane protein
MHNRTRGREPEDRARRLVAWVAAGVAACLALAPAAHAEMRIAVVDMQRALNECDAGKKAKDQVKAKFEKSQDQLRKQREDLDRMKEDYDRKALVLKDEERRSLEKDLENRGLEFKRKYEDFQRDLKRTDAELTSSIVEELYAIVRDYGQRNNYALVLEASSGALLYNDKAIDITDEIVRLHNASPHKDGGGRRGKDKE